MSYAVLKRKLYLQEIGNWNNVRFAKKTLDVYYNIQDYQRVKKALLNVAPLM